MIEYLTLDQVLEIHTEMLRLYGGFPGIRDLNLLYSLIETPKLNVFGRELYPTIYDKAGVYLFFITKNHPFNDGNKRTAYISTLLFLKGNGYNQINFDSNELENLILEVAKGEKDKENIVAFLEYGFIHV